jgi:hypothetical protein
MGIGTEGTGDSHDGRDLPSKKLVTHSYLTDTSVRTQEPLNHSAKCQERNSGQPTQRVEPDHKKIKWLSVDAYLGRKRVTVTGS